MFPDPKHLKPFPLPPAYACFGCGQANDHGLKMRFSTDGRAMYSFLMVPGHLAGWSNLVHGGVSATILDEIMSRAVLFLTRSVGVTRSMSIELLHPVRVGEALVAEGRLVGYCDASRSKADAEGVLYDRNGKVLARSTGVFVLMTPEGLRERGFQGEELLSWFQGIDFPVSSDAPCGPSSPENE